MLTGATEYAGRVFLLFFFLFFLFFIVVVLAWTILCQPVVPDKSGYQENIFLISPCKHMLWVLVRGTFVTPF